MPLSSTPRPPALADPSLPPLRSSRSETGEQEIPQDRAPGPVLVEFDGTSRAAALVRRAAAHAGDAEVGVVACWERIGAGLASRAYAHPVVAWDMAARAGTWDEAAREAAQEQAARGVAIAQEAGAAAVALPLCVGPSEHRALALERLAQRLGASCVVTAAGPRRLWRPAGTAELLVRRGRVAVLAVPATPVEGPA